MAVIFFSQTSFSCLGNQKCASLWPSFCIMDQVMVLVDNIGNYSRECGRNAKKKYPCKPIRFVLVKMKLNKLCFYYVIVMKRLQAPLNHYQEAGRVPSP